MIDTLYSYKSPSETKQFGFQVTEIDEMPDTNMAVIKGYGAVFGNVDLGRDVIVKGAFRKTLMDKGNKVYFLSDHRYDTNNLLGVATVEEDDFGLKGSYEINLDLQKGREIYSQAKQMQEAGLPLGMSIGFDIIQDEIDQTTSVRMLKELRLHEISITMFPMNPEARVTDVKSMSREELVKLQKDIQSLLDSESLDSTSNEEADEQIEHLIKSIQDARKK